LTSSRPDSLPPRRLTIWPSRRLAVSPSSGAVVLLVSWLAAFNLRSGFIGLGPALPAMTGDLGLSFSQASFLVAVPTLMMGLMAVKGGTLADRWGPAWVITLGLSLVAFGGGLRAVAPEFVLLLVLTFLFGAGIGLSQPSLPRLMRAHFPSRLGATTGIYASGMITGSIVAASVTGPIVDRLGEPSAWRVPLALWGVLAMVSLVVWVAVMRPWRGADAATAAQAVSVQADAAALAWSPWRDRRTWIAAFFFAAQGLIYYLLVAWLPTIYHEAGAGATAVAGMFAVFNAATLPAILLFPSWSDRVGRRRPPSIAAALCVLGGVLGLLVLPLADPWRWLWPALAGAGVSGLFAMSLVLPADIAPRGRTGAAAGMVLAVGYVGSALGPILAGAVRDLTGSFAVTLATLPALAVATIVLAAVVPEIAPRAGKAPLPSPTREGLG
jgi:MFS transporter, CP family, cyanate transporter